MLFTEPTDPVFARIEEQHRWVFGVLLAEYGEIDLPGDIPAALNWPEMVPASRRLDFEDVECGLVYVSPSANYACSVWDASGESDDPWAVLVADDAGVRLLAEYSVFDENADDAVRAAVLSRAAGELPARLEAGEFARPVDAPTPVPAWLLKEE